ncbi:MAG: Crp/Fnr family transcriptional regulator [Paracoccus denitrificans]|nr:MAG: Crp/Fnr family transcriptional regulator [Paracoccus denitrificans]PZO83985.1 MAG: Crp/Fnr family transcriptional regulator [Paracoccus denitrificans]
MALSEFFVRYLQLRDELSAEDLARLRAIRTTIADFDPGAVIIPSEVPLKRSCMMLRGFAGRVHVVPTRRQGSLQEVITALHVPGDFVDLHGFVLTGLEHEVRAYGPAQVEFVDHDELRDITERFPHLTRLLWMSTAIDAAIHRQWLVAAGSLRSTAHLAHLLCEIYARLASVGAAHDGRMTFPLLQRQLAQALGYSSIHINRAVRELRDRSLLTWNGVEVHLRDLASLQALAQFDPTYLDAERQAR